MAYIIIRAQYDDLQPFDAGSVIGLKEAGWSNQSFAHYLERSDAIIEQFWLNISSRR